MSIFKNNSNHLVHSLMTKGLLGSVLGLATKGVLSKNVNIIVTTKKGKKGGSSAFGAYDKDYWKRFRRDLEEDDDEIELIEVSIEKKFLPRKYNISARLLNPIIVAELLEIGLFSESNVPTINIEFIEPSSNKVVLNTPKIDIELLDSTNESDYKFETDIIKSKIKNPL